MKLENVFAGCTKDGKERIFQRRYREYDGCSYTAYIDLRTNKEFTCLDIDIDSLVPYTKIVPNRKYDFKRRIVKTFKSDTRLLYHVDNLFLGNLYTVNWVCTENITEFNKRNNRLMDIGFKEGNRLFVKVCETEFRDLRNGKLYKKQGEDTLNIGDICVSDLRNANEMLKLSFDGTLVSKQYVLRKHYQKYGKK